MKRVLYISFCYPPLSGIASLRSAKMAKYLPDFGWEPAILTVKEGDFMAKGYELDLEDELGDRGKIYRTDYKDMTNGYKKISNKINSHFGKNQNNSLKKFKKFISEFIYFPDWFKGWRSSAVRKGIEILKNEKIDLIFSTSDPITANLIACTLKQKTALPWIAEFRDLWTQSHFYCKNLFVKYFEELMEKRVLKHADALITVSEPWKQKLEEFHNKKTYVVTNGFDPEDYRKETVAKDKFLVAYAGSFYPQGLDPTPLFKAIADLKNEKLINSNDFEVLFYGGEDLILEKMIKDYNIEAFVRQCGKISHEKIVEVQKSANILLFLDWMKKNEAGWYSGKIFEYLGARKNILAIGYKNRIVGELLEKTGAGKIFDNAPEIKEYLKSKIFEYNEKKELAYHGIEDEINKYSRKTQAEKLAKIFDELAQY